MGARGNCPSDGQMAQFAQGKLQVHEADDVAIHVVDCPACSDRLALADAGSASLLRVLRHRPATETASWLERPQEVSTIGPPATATIGAPPRGDEAIRALLRRRLVALAVLGVIGFGTQLFVQAFREGDQVTRLAGGPFEIVMDVGACLLTGAIGVFLWRRPAVSLPLLRGVELVAVAILIVFMASFRYSLLAVVPRMPFSSPEHRGIYIEQATLLSNLGWYIGLVAYGLAIPNTGRRCALISLIIGASALASLAVAGQTIEGIREPVSGLLPPTFMGLVIAGSLAVFGSFRISNLQREVAEARQYGPYRLVRRLGAGGMGEVHLAEHSLLKRPCAIKIIRPERAGDPRVLQRFEREVQATARLTHPNTVEVYDYGRTDDGTFFYVMEYLAGQSLEEVVQASGPLTPDRAVQVLGQVCDALAEAHGAGLVHRDVKPANVMLCTQGNRTEVVKLLDFGLVRMPSDLATGEAGLTQEGFILGTPAYMAPEQARGEVIDGRADIYSVGALGYFLLAGRPPFVRPTVIDALLAVANDRPPVLRDLAPGVPADLAAVVDRCLAKLPAERFATVNDLATALQACVVRPSQLNASERAGTSASP